MLRKYLGGYYDLGNQSEFAANSAEYYDPATYSWSMIKSMWSKRYGLAADVLGEKIYVVGGRV